jgi:protein gp37
MGANSAIGWTNHTYNPWRGCTKVGPGCEGCYAAARDALYEGGIHWGAGAPRIRASEHTRNLPSRIVRMLREGKLPSDHNRVFAASLADILDNEVDPVWRSDFWDTVRKTPELRYQIVTKRIGNAAKMLPPDWPGPYRHVGFLATTVTQDEFDRDVGKLRALKTEFHAAWVGLSIEPQLEPIDITGASDFLDWVITGGESLQTGHQPRPYDIDWARSLIFQCRTYGIAVFVKQLGSFPYSDGRPMHGGGRSRDPHADPERWPSDIRIQEFPKALAA